MNKQILKALATVGVITFGIMGVAKAALVDVSLNLSDWSYYHEASGGSMQQTPDGIMFTGSGFRKAGAIYSNKVYDLSDTNIYFKWKANVGQNGDYMGTGPLIGNINAAAGVAGTTHHSWNGSYVLPKDTWIYTWFDTNPDMTYRVVTSTGNYYNSIGSHVLNDVTLSLKGDSNFWNNNIKNGRLQLALWDNYGGTNASALLSEVKMETVPEPTTILLMGAGLVGLIGARRKKNK